MILAATTTVFEGLFQLFTLIIVFALVLAMTYFATRLAGTYQKNNMTGKNIRIIETLRISGTKYLQLISVGNRYYAIAVCKDSVTLLGELKEEDISLEIGTTQVGSESFRAILDKFKKDKPED